MILLLFLCCLPSLCLSHWTDVCHSSSASVRQLYERFFVEHTEFDVKLKCDVFMNRILQQQNSRNCKPCHTIITAGLSLRTLASELKDVCRGVTGYRVRGDMFQSVAAFYVVTCWNTNSIASPPNCRYIPQSAKQRLTITCEDGYPVYLDTCYN